MSEHVWADFNRPATCSEDAYVWTYCGNCLNEKTVSIPDTALGHDWNEAGRKEATCVAPGSIQYSCTRCNETKTEALSALDHAWEETGRTPPTCVNAGLIHKTCTRCGFSVSEKIPALGSFHAWEETSRTDATQTAAGSVEYTCSTCGAVRSERIPPAGLDLSMSGLLDQMTAVLVVCLDWVGIVGDVIARNPILLLTVVIGFIGTGVVLFRRILRL